MAKKFTMRDLAGAAKVSPATISRILAGNPSVDPEIRKHVHKVAQKLGIDLESRRKGKSKVMAFLLANRDVLHSFQARVLLGAENYCAQHNWELLFMSFRYVPETPPAALHLPQLLSNRTNARAVILGGTNYPNLLAALEARGLPFAVLGNNVIGDWPESRCDAAYSDDIAGAREATAYLASKGHRAIGFIGNLQLPWFRRCATGYEQAMTAARLPLRYIDMRSDGSQLGYLAAKALLTQHADTTAILAGSDQVAAGVYDALREAGISVPDRMSVMGFNDTQGEMLYPALSSVREFPEELGQHLAEFALGRLQNPALTTQKLTVPTQLVLRASVTALSGNAES
ncbi:MAG TPA: LacI family DNA-binding transcriptional regulator [Opitutaceae bacterium]|nr:LacI family DNA-binding transcriptional regulator [Opitutaceae bacterium]